MIARDYLKAHSRYQKRIAKIEKSRRELILAGGYAAHTKPHVMQQHEALSAEWRAAETEYMAAFAAMKDAPAA